MQRIRTQVVLRVPICQAGSLGENAFLASMCCCFPACMQPSGSGCVHCTAPAAPAVHAAARVSTSCPPARDRAPACPAAACAAPTAVVDDAGVGGGEGDALPARTSGQQEHESIRALCGGAGRRGRESKHSKAERSGRGAAGGERRCRSKVNGRMHAGVQQLGVCPPSPLLKRSIAAWRSREAVEPSMRSQGWPASNKKQRGGREKRCGHLAWLTTALPACLLPAVLPLATPPPPGDPFDAEPPLPSAAHLPA